MIMVRWEEMHPQFKPKSKIYCCHDDMYCHLRHINKDELVFHNCNKMVCYLVIDWGKSKQYVIYRWIKGEPNMRVTWKETLISALSIAGSYDENRLQAV
jgi:hypothetical protein